MGLRNRKAPARTVAWLALGCWLAGLGSGLVTSDAHAIMAMTCRRVGIGVAGGEVKWASVCTWSDNGSAAGGFVRPAGDPVIAGGGSGGVRPAVGAKEQETDDRQDATCGETAGNPVVLYTGNKVETELDFAAADEMGLFLQRTYNHFWGGIGLFGKHWLSNFDYSLAFSSNTAWVQRPDGRRIKFLSAGADRWNEDKAQPVAYLVRNADGTYTLHNEDRGTEVYNADGYVLERRNEQGLRWTFAYSGKYLQEVTHSSGRSVRFGWANGQIEQVTDPAGNVYRYTYTPDVFGTGRGRLASTVMPGVPATTIGYHYEDARFPGGLTGKSFNGVRYSRFAYDAQGRAISTEHADGVDRYTFTYNVDATEELPLPPPTPAPGGFLNDNERHGCGIYKAGDPACYRDVSVGGASFYSVALLSVASVASVLTNTTTTQQRPTRLRVTETNPLGRKTTHLYEDGKKVSVTGDASPKCAASYRELTYDANGYEDVVGDFTDRLTDFDYDAHGHLLKKVEAAGTPLARVTSQEWDEAANRVVRVTVAGDTDTRYAWTANGRIASVTVHDLSGKGRSGKTAFAYTEHANGVLATMTVDGPLANDTVTSTFSAAGDLLATRDSQGNTTRYEQHDGLGQPGRITGPSGDVTVLAYDARGRLVNETRVVGGTSHSTRREYNGAGLLAKVQAPDGQARHFAYDAAQRLVEAYERQPDGLYTRERTTYNALSQPVAVEVQRTPYPHDTRINGHLEGVIPTASGHEAHGWACSTGQDAAIDVDLFAGDAPTAATILGRFPANRTSEPAVANACGALGSAYRFSIPLTDATRDAHGGKALYVHGVSPAGKDNAVIPGSGIHAIPRLTPTAAPSGLSAPAQNTTGSYTVSWSSAPRATAYKLEESGDGGAWTEVHNAAGTSKAIAGKAVGTYRYRVSALNESGTGPTSAITQVEVLMPATPRIFFSEREQSGTDKLAEVSCSIEWTSAPHASSYQLMVPSSGHVQYSGPSTSVTGSGQQYCAASHVVRACNAVGCSAWSSPPFPQTQFVIGAPR